MKSVVVVAFATFLLGHVVSQAQSGRYETYGQGNQSCGQWTEKNKDLRDTHLLTWVTGFVSGAGYTDTYSLRQTDSLGMAARIDQYCASHPLDTIAKAAGVLVVELEKR